MNYYQGQAMQGQALPVSPTQIMSQPLPVNIGQPPFVPLVNVPQNIQQFVPLIMSVIVMEIQTKMQQNPLRVFMFNWYSRNGYNNPEMTELLEICCNSVLISLMYGQETDPTVATFNKVPNIVTMMAGAQIKPFPALLQTLTQDQAQAAANGASALEQVVREIMQRFGGQQQFQQPQQQFQQPGQQFANFGAYGGQQFQPQGGPRSVTMAATNTGNSGLFTQSQYQPAAQPVYNAPPTPGNDRFSKQLQEQLERQRKEQQAQFQQPQPSGAPVFNNTSPTTSHRTVADLLGQNAGGEKSGYLAQPFQPANHAAEPAVMEEFTAKPASAAKMPETQPHEFFQGVGQQSQYQQPVQQPVVSEAAVTAETSSVDAVAIYPVDQVPSKVTWRRSDRQPYHPAWNPRKQKLMYAVINDGSVLAVVTDIHESEKDMMEYEKHVIGTIPTDAPIETGPTEQAIVDHVLKPEDVKIEFADKATLFDSERSAYLHTRMQVTLSKKLDDVDAYTIPGVTTTPLICDSAAGANAYREVLTKVRDARNFSEVIKIINGLTTTKELQLRTFVNDMFTEELNSVLALELGLAGCYIDDFAEDAESLGAVLHRAYGEAISIALKGYELKVIERCIVTMSEEESVDYSRMMLEDMEGYESWGGEIAYASSICAYTYINSYAHELNIAGKKDATLLVTEEANLKLHTIIEKVLEHAEQSDNNYRRLYLITRDGIRFEIGRGLINTAALLIRKAACPI